MNVSLYRILACTVVVLAPTAALSLGAPDEKINVQCIVDSQVYQATADDMSVGPDGTVKLQGIADCGPESGGGTGPGEAPATLSIDFNTDQTPGGSITIPASQQSVPVPVHAIFQGYGAGAPFFQDSCTASAGAGNMATVSPAQPSASFTLGVGNHTLSLGCSRSFGAAATQNLNVVLVPTKTRQVSIVQEGGGETGDCAAPAGHFSYVGGGPLQYTANYNTSTNSGGWKNAALDDFHPGLGTPWRYWSSPWSPSGVVSIRSWEFTPPDNSQVAWRKGEHSKGQFALAISECPGQFLAAERPGDSQNQANCMFNGSDLRWATGNRHNIVSCNLEAGRKYYLNLAAIDMSHYEQCMASPGASECIRNSFNCLEDGCSIQIEAVKE